MPHSIGGTVSKADLAAAENSFATASVIYEASQSAYHKAEEDFFKLEEAFFTAESEFFTAEGLFITVINNPDSSEEDIEEATTNKDEAQDNRDDAFQTFRAKDLVVRQSESLFIKTERTYFDEQEHLFQVQDQYNFQVNELRESTGVRSGIQNNFDQYLFTGRDSATDATARANAQSELAEHQLELENTRNELNGVMVTLKLLREDWENQWISSGRPIPPKFEMLITNMFNAEKIENEQHDAPINDAQKAVIEAWCSKSGIISLWTDYELNYNAYKSFRDTLSRNPQLIKELTLILDGFEERKAEIETEIKSIKEKINAIGEVEEGSDEEKEVLALEAEITTLEKEEKSIDAEKDAAESDKEKAEKQLEEAETRFNKHGDDFGTDYEAKLTLYNKAVEVGMSVQILEKEADLEKSTRSLQKQEDTVSETENQIEAYEAILRPKEDALALTEIFVEQIAGAITAGGDSESKVIKAAKEKGQKAGENITATDALALARSFNWSMKQIKAKVTEAAEKGETAIIVSALSPATVSVLNDMGYNMKLIDVEKEVIKVDNALGRGRFAEVVMDQEIEISWLFARDANIGDYVGLE
jgi:hypothetical protein